MENNTIDLENEIITFETDALKEEQANAKNNYSYLKSEIEEKKKTLPHPNITPSTIGRDYEDRERINFQKQLNASHWNTINRLQVYYDSKSLYCGHVQIGETYDAFIMDSTALETLPIGNNIILINSDDKRYSDVIQYWHYPDSNTDVVLSRNISMENKNVTEVDVVLDRRSNLYSSITDSYLRKALIRNKSKNEIQSIIQTIQKKQDFIRQLDKNVSFIVQGCAGSGKTMVLLHRLRYLIFNKEINNDDYVLLTPSQEFKEYIKGVSSKFNINYNKTFTFQEYFASIASAQSNRIENSSNELVFGSNYLEIIYSKEFIQKCFNQFLTIIYKNINKLIEFGEAKQNELFSTELNGIRDRIESLKKTAISSAQVFSKNIQKYISIEISDNYHDILTFANELKAQIDKKEEEAKKSKITFENLSISPQDERLITDERLIRLKSDLQAQESQFLKASIFTRNSHKTKLEHLKVKYQELYDKIVSELLEDDRKAYIENSSKSAKIFPDISFEEAKEILSNLIQLYETINNSIKEETKKFDNLDEYFAEKHNEKIANLTELIDFSTELFDCIETKVDLLDNSWDILKKCFDSAFKVYEEFIPYCSDKKTEEQFKCFKQKTDSQLEVYLSTFLFNQCKKTIKSQFDIKINKLYKHYWYLLLYCQYLSKSKEHQKAKYVYIDEAQDLSTSEIELIYKINSSQDKNQLPILNLFGDVNQTISSHSTKDWSKVAFIETTYSLDENFRNTNQIIDFCNNKLPFKMEKVGIDVEAVACFNSITEFIKTKEYLTESIVFVVKDEYAEQDLSISIANTPFNSCAIYTVKKVKGLEFKAVCVVDRDMTINEKYISYTRSLSKLIVINDMPYASNRKENLIIQDDDSDDSTLLEVEENYEIDYKTSVSDDSNIIMIDCPGESVKPLQLKMPIEELDLSVRSFNCLKRAGINTVKDITQLTFDQLSHVHDLGKKSTEEVIQKLETMGLSLKSDD